jgi:hypothetical protein
LAVVVLHAWRKTSSATVAAAVGLLAFAGCWQTLTIRPQSVSMLLFAAEYASLDLSERRRGWLAVPPVLAALWANVHGAFPLAWVLVGIWLAAALADAWLADGWRGLWTARTQSLTLCLAATVLATLINPYGWTVYEYVGGTSSVAAARRIDEWIPPGLTLLIGQIWLASLVVALVVLFWSPRRLSIRESLLLLAFLPLAAGSVRMVVWWFLVLTPILAESIAAMMPRRIRDAEKDEPAWGNTSFAALLALVAVMCLPALSAYNPLVRQEARTEGELALIADELRARDPGGRIFSRLEWGEYLSWSLAGRNRVFMDGRIEIIPDDIWEDYAAITCGHGEWQAILNRYQVDHLVLDRDYHSETGLLAAVERSRHWQPVAQHGPAVLYIRRDDLDGE